MCKICNLGDEVERMQWAQDVAGGELQVVVEEGVQWESGYDSGARCSATKSSRSLLLESSSTLLKTRKVEVSGSALLMNRR